MKKIILILVVLCSNYVLHAQAFSLDKNLKPIEIKLKPFEPKTKKHLKGKAAIMKACQIKDTAYYFVKGISIYSLVKINVSLKQKNNPIQISIHKNSWNTALKKDNTNAQGTYSETFKTEGSFSIRVISKQLPSSYNMFVWVSDEVKPKMQAPFKTKKK